VAYSDVSDLKNDGYFQNRVTACLAMEGQTSPESVLLQVIWPVAAAPGFGDAYASGGQDTITDAQILSAVQAALGQAT
jgi:hypothetical protein